MKKFLALLCVLSVLSVPAFASFTRLSGLNLPAPLTNTDQLIFSYPSEILNFGNEVVGEYNGLAFGYTLLKMKGSALGLMFIPNPGISVALNPTLTSTVAGVPSLYNIDSVIGAIYGLNLSKTGIALSVIYGSDMTSQDLQLTGAVADKDHAGVDQAYLKFGIGATLDIGMPLDVALSIALPGYSSNPKVYSAPPGLVLSNDSYEKLNALDISAGARAVIDNMIFNLAFAFVSETAESRNWQDTNLDGTAETNMLYTSTDSTIVVNALFGNKMNPLKNMEVTLGGGLSFNTTGSPKDTIKNEVTPGTTYGTAADTGMEFWLPLYASADCRLNENFQLSAGINKNLAGITLNTVQTVLASDGKTVQYKRNDSEIDFNTPISLASCVTGIFGDVKVDLLLNLDFFTTGNQSISSSAAVTYSWK